MEFQRNRLNRRVIHDLKKRSTIGIVFYLTIICVNLFSYDFHTRYRNEAFFFLCAVYTVCLFRLLHLPIARWTRDKFERLNNIIFYNSVILTAIVWGGFFAWFMTIENETQSKLLTAICSTGLCAGGVVSFIPNLTLSICFNFAMLLPASFTMLYFHTNYPLVILIFLYSAYLVLIAGRGNREYWDALENEFLLKKNSEELKKLSRIDVLTGLYNRRYFNEAFDFEWKRAVRNRSVIHILICDIDHFKKVNDRHGHLAGDEYLKLTAQILTSVFKRDTDTVARYGGEEFVVMTSDISPDTVVQLAEKVRKAIAACTLVYQEQIISTTLSIGLSYRIPDSNDSKKSLISEADTALYTAKAEGRNQVRMAAGVC